jgi:hypothetical protein
LSSLVFFKKHDGTRRKESTRVLILKDMAVKNIHVENGWWNSPRYLNSSILSIPDPIPYPILSFRAFLFTDRLSR